MSKETVRFTQLVTAQRSRKGEYSNGTVTRAEVFGLDEIGRVWRFREDAKEDSLWSLTEFKSTRTFQWATANNDNPGK